MSGAPSRARGFRGARGRFFRFWPRCKERMAAWDACAARLAACSAEGARALTAEGWEGLARVVDVHDGDTLTVAAEVFGPGAGAFLFNVRVAGVVAPREEARLVELLLAEAPGAAAPAARPPARAAFEACAALVRLRVLRLDERGRYVAEVTLPRSGRSAAGALAQERLAEPR